MLFFIFPIKSFSANDLDTLNITYCAEVLPCDEFGNVLKEYLDSGDCLNVYKERCLRFKLSDISKKQSTCNDELAKKNKKIRRLKARVKYLTR